MDADELTPKELEEKLKNFQSNIETLKAVKENARLTEVKYHEKRIEYIELKKNIEKLELIGRKALDTKVNIGSDVYVNVHIPDTRSLFLDMGFGFYLDFNWKEAHAFLSEKLKLLKHIEAVYCKKQDIVADDIRLLEDGMRLLRPKSKSSSASSSSHHSSFSSSSGSSSSLSSFSSSASHSSSSATSAPSSSSSATVIRSSSTMSSSSVHPYSSFLSSINAASRSSQSSFPSSSLSSSHFTSSSSPSSSSSYSLASFCSSSSRHTSTPPSSF
eukprot:TRINITY_DN10159_c0_g1_i1.p1 TRINITY_DN10159_c0_g1~~TRINITY_DN10159_c0_g1_i1.p1  ORF type:complete len:272 (+),score=113.58 TRINITY_DN10159_c0_g1_i1:137-952(+)